MWRAVSGTAGICGILRLGVSICFMQSLPYLCAAFQNTSLLGHKEPRQFAIFSCSDEATYLHLQPVFDHV